MHRMHAKTCSIVAILSSLITHCLALDEPPKPAHDAGSRGVTQVSDGQATSRPNAREAVEAFVAAALVGETSDTTVLARSGMSPEAMKGINEFRETLDAKPLEIASVRMSGRKRVALAVSRPLEHTGSNLVWCAVFRLIRSEEGWFLRQVSSMSEDGAGQLIDKYNRIYPDAEEIAPVLDSDDVRSTSGIPANVIMPDLHLLGVPSVPTTEYVAGTDVIVSWSEKGEWSEKADAVWGFTTSTRKWTKQEIQPAADEELAPLVSGSLAALQVGHAIYAYSAQTGRWDVLRLPADRKPQVSIHPDMVLARGEQDVYTFPISSGRWTSRDATVPANLAAGKLAHELTVFYLKNAEARSAAAILNQLFGGFPIVVDRRLNAIIVRGDSQEDLSRLEALLKKLDQPQAKQGRSPSPQDFMRAMRGAGRAKVHAQPATLREKYNEFEQQAAELAEQYRDLPDKATRARTGAAALKTHLAETVRHAFEARQELQRAELAALRQRLACIEQQIATRERIKDKIIDRRIEDLLNPEFRWDGTGESTTRPAASARVSQSQAPQAVTQMRDYVPTDSKADAQITFRGLEGARVTCSRRGSAAAVFRLPGRTGVSTGQTLSIRLSDIPGHAGLELNGTIELPLVSEQTRTFLQHNAIPIQFHNEDVDQASSGNLVTKVVYLPKPEFQEIALAGVETIVSTRLDPGVNPVVEADRRGYVLATMRLGNRVSDGPSTAVEEAAHIRGRWKVTDVKIPANLLSGEALKKNERLAMPREEFLISEVLITADQYILWPVEHMGLPDALKSAVTYAVDLTKTPNTVDLLQDGETFARGIYRLEGDRLQMHLSKSSDRPGDFEFDPEGKGSQLVLRRIASLDDLFLDITVTANGAAVVGGRETDEKSLDETLRFLLQLNPRLRIHLSSHPDTPYRQFAQWMDRIRDAGVFDISVRQVALEDSTRGLQKPANDPSDAIVWIEAIIEERQSDGGQEPEAIYMFGTIVSPDGLIATVLEKGQAREDVFEQFRTATVGHNRKGRLVAYQPEYGIALLKVDATGLPFLALASDPIAANRRLGIHVIGGHGPSFAPKAWAAHVFQTNHRIGETEGFFTIVASGALHGLHVGAALVSANGQLQGMIGRQTLPLELPGPDGSEHDPNRPKFWAIPANVIARLIEEYRAEPPESDALSAPNADSAPKAASNTNWAGRIFSETLCNLGVVAPGAKVQYRFALENPYVEDARIASVRSANECISALQVTKPLLKTHDKSEIVVQVAADQAPGDHTETLTVVFDKPFDAEVGLRLKWSVRELPQLEPVDEETRADGAEMEAPAKLIWDVLGVKLRPVSQDALPNKRFRGGMQVIEVRKDGAAAEAKLQVDDIVVGIHHWETISLEKVAYVLNHSDLQPKQDQSFDAKCYVLRGDETLFTTLRLADPSKAAD